MSEWQPIETAPQDGTAILLWLPVLGGKDGGMMRLAYFRRYPPNSGHWPELGARWTNGDGWSTEVDRPSHWMPLPEPPKDDTP